jgi:hypothetical protein
LRASGPKPRSAQMHSTAGPAATRGTARMRDAGAARTTRGGGAAWRRRSSATAVLGELTAARRRRTGDGRERWLTGAEMAVRCDGDGRAASGARRSGRRSDEQGDRGDGGAREAVGSREARARRAVGTRGALSR